MQTIFRTKLTRNFTTLPNEMLRDSSLSFAARGMLAMVLSNSAEWQVHAGWLEQQSPAGKGHTASTLRELERAGYAVFRQERDEKNRWAQAIWTFHDTPVPESDRSSLDQRRRGVPADRFPANRFSATGKTDPKKYYGKERSTAEERLSEESKETPSAAEADAEIGERKPEKQEAFKDFPVPKPKAKIVPLPPPSEAEFAAFCDENELEGILTFRPDLWLELHNSNWRVWNDAFKTSLPIRNWKLYVAALNDTIVAARNRMPGLEVER